MIRLLVALPVILMALCCKKEKSAKLTPVEVVEPGEEPAETKLQPVQLLNGKAKTTFSYTGNRLIKMENSDNTHTTIRYDEHQSPLILENFTDEIRTGYSDYSVDASGQVVLVEKYTYKGLSLILLYTYKLTYNTSQQLCRIQTLNEYMELLNDRRITYDNNGNRKSVVFTTPQQTLVYTYDTRNALFKNMEYAFLLELETENPIFLSSSNNLIQVSGATATGANLGYDYNYNASNYPERIKVKIDGKTSSTYEVTYQ